MKKLSAPQADSILAGQSHFESSEELLSNLPSLMVRRCKLKRVETRAETAWCQRLTLGCDKPVSSFASTFNLV